MLRLIRYDAATPLLSLMSFLPRRRCTPFRRLRHFDLMMDFAALMLLISPRRHISLRRRCFLYALRACARAMLAASGAIRYAAALLMRRLMMPCRCYVDAAALMPIMPLLLPLADDVTALRIRRWRYYTLPIRAMRGFSAFAPRAAVDMLSLRWHMLYAAFMI